MRSLRCITSLLVIGGLLLGGVGLARSHHRGGPAFSPPGRAATATRPQHLSLPLPLPALGGLPIGTGVEAAFYDAEPAEADAPKLTLALTVGVDSEAAFARAFGDAREDAADWEAAYLVVTIGEQVRTVVLPMEEAAALPMRRAWSAAALRLPTAAMGDGDTITVTLYDGDPDEGGELLETLVFTHGVDSAIGFRAALAEALEAAAVAVVTISPRSLTIDLKAFDARGQALAERLAERSPWMAERFAERFGKRWEEPAEARRPALPMPRRPAWPGRR